MPQFEAAYVAKVVQKACSGFFTDHTRLIHAIAEQELDNAQMQVGLH